MQKPQIPRQGTATMCFSRALCNIGYFYEKEHKGETLSRVGYALSLDNKGKTREARDDLTNWSVNP
jgi:hypothetical protein